MKTKGFNSEEYYNRPNCQKCRGPLTKKDRAICKKAGFLLLCDKCYPVIREALAKCLPLFEKFKNRQK